MCVCLVEETIFRYVFVRTGVLWERQYLDVCACVCLVGRTTFLDVCVCVCEMLQLCLTLALPYRLYPLGSVFLDFPRQNTEWLPVPSSRGPSQLRDLTPSPAAPCPAGTLPLSHCEAHRQSY